MPARMLEARVRRQPGAAIIDLRGEINSFGETALNAAYADAEKQGNVPILLNFTDVDYINSTGIALVVGLLGRARKARRQLLACGLSEHYIEIFQITRLVDFLSIFPDEASALTSEAAQQVKPDLA